MKKDSTDIALVIGSGHVKLDFQQWEEIAPLIPDKRKFRPLFQALAGHPNPEIRKEIAGRFQIDRDILDVLVQDSQIDVLRALVRNETAQEWLSEEEIVRLIELDDAEILETILENTDDFDEIDYVDVAERLCTHENPRIRYLVARNLDTPDDILERLCEDPEAPVAKAARDLLQGEEDDLDLDDEDEDDEYDEEDEEDDEDEDDDDDDEEDDDDEDRLR